MAVRLRVWKARYGVLAVLLVALGLFYGIAQHSGGVATGGWPSAGCLRIFSLSRSLHGVVDHHFHAIRAPCRSDSLSAGQTHACLRRRMARLRRPTRLVLVGDSRSRILQHQLQAFLGLGAGQRMDDVSAADVPPGPLHDFQLFATRDMCPIRGKFCSDILANRELIVEFWRRPFLYTLFIRKLLTLAAQCASGRCPDLVVLNGGLWYIRMEMGQQLAIESSPTQWMLKLREHAASTREALRQLARHVTIVWRLEEAVTSDALGLGLEDMHYQRRLSVSHAFFYEIQTQVPGLIVWSSMLPETVDLAQRVCRPLRTLNISTDAVVEDLFDQCEDEIHVGPWLRQRFVSKLLDVLCEVDGDREPAHCCRHGNN